MDLILLQHDLIKTASMTLNQFWAEQPARPEKVVELVHFLKLRPSQDLVITANWIERTLAALPNDSTVH